MPFHLFHNRSEYGCLFGNPHLHGSLAIASAAAFAGAAVHVGCIGQPARKQITDPALMLANWREDYVRAAPMQASLVALSSATGCYMFWKLSREAAKYAVHAAANKSGVTLGSGGCNECAKWWWLVGGLAMLANLPYTVWAVMPLNKKLNSMQAEASSPAQLRDDIDKWGQLHSVRTVLGVGAVCAFIVATVVQRC